MSTFSSRCMLVAAVTCAVACDQAANPRQPENQPVLQPQQDGSLNNPQNPLLDGGSNPSENDPPVPQGAVAASTRANLQWKRYAPFESDLANALEIPKDQLCVELGRENCIRGVHLTPLGGHDPFATGLLESSAEPLGTTPTVVERVVLSACSKRIADDLKTGKPSSGPFAAIDLSKSAPALTDSGNKALVNSLYQRLLGRDADPEELAAVGKLAVDEQGKAVSGSDFALGACVAIGTSTEFLFF